MTSALVSSRVPCPCCGYPTLAKGADNDICELCNWEDDGQGEEEAAEVWGGPNSDYSLTEARENFKRFRVMYAPGRDRRITPGDSPLQFETKGLLINAFERLARASSAEADNIETEIVRLEQVLSGELHRTVGEYVKRHRGDA
jgi:hypothetical protein